MDATPINSEVAASNTNETKPPASQEPSEAPALPPRPPATEDELASLLNAGQIQEFNARRPEGQFSFKNVSFSRAVMDGADLRYIKFDKCTFLQCSMVTAALASTTFEGCVLVGCHCNGAVAYNLTMNRCLVADSHFRNSRLDWARFSNSEVLRCVFDQASLSGAVFQCASVESCEFDKVVARSARLELCKLSGANFRGSDLGKIAFTQTVGERIIFDGSNLCDASFNGSFWQDKFSVHGAYMKQGTLQQYMFQTRTWDDGQVLKHINACAKPPEGTFDSLKPEVETSKSLVDGIPGTDRVLYEKAMRDLSNMIGLDEVKREVEELAAVLRVVRHRQLLGGPAEFGSMHYVFSGPPGTGKTTVARIFGDLLKSLGYLSKGHFVETDRSGLVGRYLGETGLKTKAVVDEAAGGVLFIDEAYTLTAPNNQDQYGQESVATLLKLMEDRRRDLVVIAAGYGQEMESFIRANPGLQSRFSNTLRFRALATPALTDVAKGLMTASGFVADDETVRGVSRLIGLLKERDGEGFGNARTVRNIFEKMVRLQAVRLTKEGALDESRLNRFTFDDIPSLELMGLSHKDLRSLMAKDPISTFEREIEALFRAKLGR
jgi:uncharacterized protein YjbI with pentapeptide repeats